MSTKISLKFCKTDNCGFHLYEESTFADTANGPEPSVYLRLDGVQVQMETLEGGGASVTVEIPRELARELGLIPIGHEK